MKQQAKNFTVVESGECITIRKSNAWRDKGNLPVAFEITVSLEDWQIAGESAKSCWSMISFRLGGLTPETVAREKRMQSFLRQSSASGFVHILQASKQEKTAKGRVQILIGGHTTEDRVLTGTLLGLRTGLDGHLYVAMQFDEDCYIGLCNGNPRSTWMPVSRDVLMSFKAL